MLYIKKWIVYSERSGNHIVSQCEDETYTCDCVGWTRHYPRKNCKHIREVLWNNPEPINQESWDALKGKKLKVKATLTFFAKLKEQEEANARRDNE